MSGTEIDARGAFGLFQAAKLLDELARETTILLGQAGVQLALAETGTAGEVARCLAATPAGRAALTQERVYRTPGELAQGLRVSSAKVEAFGAVSAMVAAEAAVELIDTYEGGWGLVVIAPAGNPQSESGVQNEVVPSPEGFVALGTPSATIIEQCPVDQLIRAALNLLSQQAGARLSRRS